MLRDEMSYCSFGPSRSCGQLPIPETRDAQALPPHDDEGTASRFLSVVARMDVTSRFVYVADIDRRPIQGITFSGRVARSGGHRGAGVKLRGPDS